MARRRRYYSHSARVDYPYARHRLLIDLLRTQPTNYVNPRRSFSLYYKSVSAQRRSSSRNAAVLASRFLPKPTRLFSVCDNRRRRREVIFASGAGGRRGRQRRHRSSSNVRC